MKLHELQEARAAVVAEMRGLADKAETEKRDLNADEDKKFGELKTSIADLDRKIARAQTLAEAERSAPAIAHGRLGDGQFEDRCREYSLVRAMAGQSGIDVDCGREREISRELARRSGRSPEGIFAPTQVFQEQRIMTPAAGGVGITPIDPRPDLYIDKLRDAIVIRRLGATVLSNLVGNVEIPRLATSATTGWVADNAALSASDQVHEKVTCAPKHAGGTVLETVKAELGVTDGSSDGKLKTLISQASDAVAKYCRRVFAKETVSETFRLSTVTESLLLARYPVASIASVTEFDTVLDAADYEVNAASGVLTRLSDDEPICWSAGKIVVLYVAGFELLTDLPQAVERACIELVKDYYYSTGRDPALRSESVDGIGSSAYLDPAECAPHLPAEVRGLLASFKNIRVR